MIVRIQSIEIKELILPRIQMLSNIGQKMLTKKRHFEVLHDGTLNKSDAFTNAEREQLGLRGLLPMDIERTSSTP